MSPEERQLLQGLFDRMRSAGNNPRDRDAETFIADNVRQQPYAPYLLSQTVIVQDQALRAANDRLQQLEAQLQDQQRQGGGQPQGQSGGFLSGIGSLFGGGGGGQPQQPRSPWNQGAPPQQGYPQQQGYAPPPPQGGPWGGQQPAGGGGGFLHGALGAAAGVAGGVLLADSIKGLFGGHNNGLGIASGVPGFGDSGFGGGGLGGGSVVNNYYGSDPGAGGGGGTAADWQQDADQDQDDAQDAGDYSSDV